MDYDNIDSREKPIYMDRAAEQLNKLNQEGKIVGKIVIETESPEDTFAFGEKLGRMSRPGQVYVLIGDLGVDNRWVGFHFM